MGLIQNKVTVSQPNSHVVVKNAGGLRGLTGETGPQGPQGVPGEAATVTAGTTTTLPAGSNATVQNVGSTSAAIFNFGIPKGDKGDTGETGAAATISVGTTTTLEPGEDATVTNSGTSSAAVFDFGIPKGAKGDTGSQGPAGQDGADGFSPTATVTKTGDTATITITDKDGTTTASISDGTTPTVNDGTLTIQKNGTTVQTFSADQASNVTANITVPTQFSELSGTVSSSQIEDEAITTGSVSGTGTNITLAGTMEGGAIESVELNGDTEQTTYSGKNLLNQPSPWSFTRITNFQPLTAGTYYVSCGSVTKGGENDPCIGASNSYVTITSNMLNKVLNFAGTDLTVYSNGWSWGASSVTSTVENLIITTSPISSIADYEPYVGGTASPNPDYPQEVQTVTGEQTITVASKNILANIDNLNATDNGITNTLNADGSITCSGTVGNGWNGWGISGYTTNELAAGTYTFSIDHTITSDITVSFRDSSNNTIGAAAITAGQTSATATISGQTARTSLWVAATVGTQIDFTISAMLEKGSLASSFVPYATQAYPINLGKNLFDKDNANTIAAYIQWTTPRVLNYSAGNSSVYIPCEPNTTYTISKVADNVFRAGSIEEAPTTGITVYNAEENPTGTSITVATSAKAKYLVVFVRNASSTNTLETILASLQIEKGSVATSYAPYFTPIELCKIGTYQDYIYKSGEDWYVKKNINKYVIDGTNGNYTRITTNRFNISGWPMSYKMERGANYSISDKYVTVQQYDTDGNFNSGTANMKFALGFHPLGGLRVKDSNYDDVDLYKAWVSANPISAYAVLATPTDTKITNATLISELEALLSTTTYSGTTYITVSGDLASPLEVVTEADSKLAPDSVYGAAIKDGAVSVDKIADLKALADALAPYLNS